VENEPDMANKQRDIKGLLMTIGDELLFGSIANGNAFYIANTLRSQGLRLAQMVTIGDAEAEIIKLLRDAIDRFDFIICTGGLGPTADDCTAPAVAKAFDRPLQRSARYESFLRAHAKQRGIPWSDGAAQMALFPEGTTKLGGEVPMAGFFLEHHTTPCYFLPGVPWEMRHFMSREVIPDLRRRFPDPRFYLKRILRVQELAESQIGQCLRDLQPEQSGCEIGYLPQLAENWVTLLAAAAGETEATKIVEAAEREVIDRLGAQHVSGRDEESLEVVIGQVLRERRWKLAVAESCTGGLISARITSVSGSSDYFDRAFVTYSNQAKLDLLGVPEGVLVAHGAVSKPAAAAMVEGALQRSAAQIAVAVTGIAGPTGGSPEKPVGRVLIACADHRGTMVKEHLFTGDREQIQNKAAHAALVLLWRRLSQ
jgi:nicotinamide-nucleotide amidase